MVKPLQIDRASFAHELPNAWRVFRDSQASTLLRAYLRRELERTQQELETTSVENLKKFQGQVELTKKFLKLVEQEFVSESTIKEIVEYSERQHGRQ